MKVYNNCLACKTGIGKPHTLCIGHDIKNDRLISIINGDKQSTIAYYQNKGFSKYAMAIDNYGNRYSIYAERMNFVNSYLIRAVAVPENIN